MLVSLFELFFFCGGETSGYFWMAGKMPHSVSSVSEKIMSVCSGLTLVSISHPDGCSLSPPQLAEGGENRKMGEKAHGPR